MLTNFSLVTRAILFLSCNYLTASSQVPCLCFSSLEQTLVCRTIKIKITASWVFMCPVGVFLRSSKKDGEMFVFILYGLPLFLSNSIAGMFAQCLATNYSSCLSTYLTSLCVRLGRLCVNSSPRQGWHETFICISSRTLYAITLGTQFLDLILGDICTRLKIDSTCDDGEGKQEIEAEFMLREIP